MKTITKQQVLAWLVKQPVGTRYTWSNTPACFFTQFMRATTRFKKSLVQASGKVRSKEESSEFIANIPFHDAFWGIGGACNMRGNTITREEAIIKLTELLYAK